jgi:hypothetical protein
MTAVTPLATRPIYDSTDSLLRFAMRLDATLGGAVGLFIALMADPLSSLTGLSSVAEFSGGALLVHAVLTVATLGVLAAGILPLTETGVAATLATGGYFALMGYLQYLGVRRLPA